MFHELRCWLSMASADIYQCALCPKMKWPWKLFLSYCVERWRTDEQRDGAMPLNVPSKDGRIWKKISVLKNRLVMNMFGHVYHNALITSILSLSHMWLRHSGILSHWRLFDFKYVLPHFTVPQYSTYIYITLQIVRIIHTLFLPSILLCFFLGFTYDSAL